MVLQSKLSRQGQGSSGMLRLLFISLLFCSLAACSSDDSEAAEFDYPLEGSTLSMSDIAGDWNATIAEFQEVGDPSTFTELVSAGGGVTMGIESNGRFVATIGLPGVGAQTFTGQMGFSGPRLVLLDDEDDPGDEGFLNISLSPEDVLSLSGVLEFDFDATGSSEETSVNLTLVRL